MKAFKSVIVFIFSFLIFTILEYGNFKVTLGEFINPIIFACTVTSIFINKESRKYILGFSLILLLLMIILYFFNLLVISNWVGGLGMGILVILTISYTPELVKKGCIERY